MLALWLGIAWPALAGGPFVINGKLAGVEDGAVVRQHGSCRGGGYAAQRPFHAVRRSGTT